MHYLFWDLPNWLASLLVTLGGLWLCYSTYVVLRGAVTPKNLRRFWAKDR